jgi:hypothetical protein
MPWWYMTALLKIRHVLVAWSHKIEKWYGSTHRHINTSSDEKRALQTPPPPGSVVERVDITMHTPCCILNYVYLQIDNSKSYLSIPRASCVVQQSKSYRSANYYYF